MPQKMFSLARPRVISALAAAAKAGLAFQLVADYARSSLPDCRHLLLPLCAAAASKPHVVALGKTTSVKLFVGPSENKTLDITVRPLYVDAKLKEFTTGDSHDVTDREFVVRRAYRINDALPDDTHKAPKWLWQRGGWLLVDRVSGKISLVKLPDFDPVLLAGELVSRLCGLLRHHIQRRAGDCRGGRNRRQKGAVPQGMGKTSLGDSPDSNCPAPALGPAAGASNVRCRRAAISSA